MEALLPSEIARLVLGYLEDQKCTEAAKLFLETSPHLRECREVLLSGRRFSTRVNGLTLIDVVEKFSAINAMIQERLNKVTDCGQLKHCGDLMEQLKFLVEEPRGQRFVVNINVPSQSNTQTLNGSPTTASNMRKRRHSNSERIKRTIKSQSNAIQQSDIMMSPSSCHNIDATPLESLPGNVDQLKQMECSTHTVEKRDDNVVQGPHRQYDSDKNNSTTTHNRSNTRMSLDDASSIRSCEIDIDNKRKEENNAISTAPKRYTTSTSTEELLSFSSAEVQTIPDEIPESESESNDEPIENLSILTKEILNRTELQECIAENINKAIIPTDLSLKDENLNESIIGDGNTSIMAELNNAIKSIVEATESDPVFEKFLDEFIGPHIETDTSPEEDGEGKLSPKSLNDGQEKQTETALGNISSPEPTIIDKVPLENGTADVPLKHRLRSSSRQQYNRIEDEVDKTRDQEKEQSALEDQNAAAILSIINANITSNQPNNVKKTLDGTTELVAASDDNKQKAQTMVPMVNKNNADLKPIQKVNNIILSANNSVQPKVRKSTVKRPRPTKSKRDQVNGSNQTEEKLLTEHEIMTMPTLIVCSKDEVNNLLINRSSNSTSRFIPIAPKDSSRFKESMETLYLRTVNVAQQVPIDRTLPTVVEESDNSASQTELLQSKRKNGKVNKRLRTVHKGDATISIGIDQQQVLDHPVEAMQTGKIVGGESITLYANENSAKTLLDGTSMPTINLEENISLSESGLSPYIKFNCSKTSQSHNLSDIDLAPMMESARNTTANNNGIDEQQSLKNAEIITKRTPKSLLKSRSKNHRLSLSTPRKRSSHIRALDFSTPTKTSSRKTNRDGNIFPSTKHLKSVCRTSLFRSPSLSNTSVQKQKSPKVCQPYRIPIATRSPAPKLMGGWDKCNGVGVIIGEVSPHGSTSASCSSSDDRAVQHKPSKTIVDSWDADLRKSVQFGKKDETETKKPVKRKDSIKDQNDMIHKKTKYNPRSTKSKNKRKTCTKMEIDGKSNHDTDDTNEPEETSQENMKIAVTEKNYCVAAVTKPRNNGEENLTKVINILDSVTDKSKISELVNTCKTTVQVNSTNSSNSNTTAEKKPVKKYAQLKTITTNLRKSDNGKEKSTEDSQISSKMSEISRILSTDNSQHFLRMPDMINLETPRKFDNTSGPPPTPRLLSPNSNVITPFIKVSEDSTKIRSFIPTPEFPITPGITITPKGETTGDIIKRNEYNSQYYKPTSEQAQNSDLKVLKLKSSVQESPIISSSHVKLQSTHNSLTSSNTYQTCTSSKLEITQFEVIKENLPREEAIKELKIASSSKDSTSAELNASVVIDHHVDLIQINEFKGTSEHCERIIDDRYVADSHTDFVESNSSSSSDTSSSSSSSSSTSTSSNTSRTCSPIEKCDKDPSKTRTDVSSDFAERSVNAPENTNVVINKALMTVPIDTCKKSDNDSIKIESSPKKVFAIAKTDEQIETTMKETPAKDETLLNEADISETPSSSKNRMEFLGANLSTKISAIITEDEKLLKSNKPPNNSDKIKMNKSKLKPKIINVQVIRPGSSKIIKPTKDKCRIEQEQSVPMYDKLLQRQQLEEKRQRMILKIKDNVKLNLSTGTKRKRILPGKASDSLKKSTRFGRGKRNIQSTASYPRKTVNKDIGKNIEPQSNLQESPTKNNMRKRYELQKQNLVNKCCDNEDEVKNQVAVSKNTDPNLMNCGNNSSKPVNDYTKQSHKNNVYDMENNVVESSNKKNEFVQSHKNSSVESQECLKEKSETKEDNCSIKDNITKGEIGEMLKYGSLHARISEKESLSIEAHISVQETSVPDKQEMNDQTEDKVNKPKQFANHADKSECYKILRYRVDQVKRDLFSDDENDHKASSSLNAKDNRTKKFSMMEIQNADIANIPNKNENAIENPKQELSTVLQCLQLVPAHKNEQLRNDESQTEGQHNEQNEHENEADNELQQASDMRNYKAEYHFVYDDSAPMRKRRRRYSGHELQIEINHADLSDPDPVEYIKIMKATEFEEIFNLPPKSKKRTVNKKSLAKTDCETHKIDKDTFTLKDNTTKPLATSSPVDEPTKTKVRKVIIKTAAANKTDNDTQSEAKKKQKLDKPQLKDITAKSRKRKLSETKETKQIDKKPCMTDPQTLLSNFGEAELNNFLTAVHGPDMLSSYKCV